MRSALPRGLPDPAVAVAAVVKNQVSESVGHRTRTRWRRSGTFVGVPTEVALAAAAAGRIQEARMFAVSVLLAGFHTCCTVDLGAGMKSVLGAAR